MPPRYYGFDGYIGIVWVLVGDCLRVLQMRIQLFKGLWEGLLFSWAFTFVSVALLRWDSVLGFESLWLGV